MKRLLLSIFVFMAGCQHGDFVDVVLKAAQGTSELSDTKDWLTRELSNYRFSDGLVARAVRDELTPTWEKALLKRNNDGFTLAVPLSFKEEVKIDNLTPERFLVREKNTKTGETQYGIITILSASRMSDDEKMAILENHKHKKIANFSGRITFSDVGLNFKEYAIYKDGNLTRQAILTAQQNGAKEGRLGYNCTDWYIVVYINGQVNSITFSHTICRCEQTRLAAYSDCGGGGGGSTVGYLDRTIPPGSKALAIFTSPCLFVNDMITRSNSTSPSREYGGILTIDGQYLVTQKLDEFGGSFAGLYKDNTTGRGLYVWPADQQQGTPNIGGAFRFNAEGVDCWAIPINAVIHTHPPNSTNTVSVADKSLAAKLPTTRFYMVNSEGNVTLYTSQTTNYSYPSTCSTLE